MRLPTLTDEHRRGEDARAFHEALWTAHLNGEALFVPTTREDCAQRSFTTSGTHHKYWNQRGFSFRVKVAVDRSGFWVRLAAKHAQVAA